MKLKECKVCGNKYPNDIEYFAKHSKTRLKTICRKCELKSGLKKLQFDDMQGALTSENRAAIKIQCIDTYPVNCTVIITDTTAAKTRKSQYKGVIKAITDKLIILENITPNKNYIECFLLSDWYYNLITIQKVRGC